MKIKLITLFLFTFLMCEAAPAEAANEQERSKSLLYAVNGGKVKDVRILLLAGANANAVGEDGFAALHRAAIEGHTQIAGLLLDHGADINTKTYSGADALTYAVCGNRVELVKLLLDREADVNSKSTDGVNLLHLALSNKFTEVAKIIMGHRNMDISVKDDFGYMPSHWIKKFGCEELLRYLDDLGGR